MKNKFLAAGSVALMGAGSFLGATAANAITVADCGDAPVGGVVSAQGEYCQIYFANSGDYEWSIPDGATDVWALLIGAGGGAGGRITFNEGYAGNGGDVQYQDLTDAAAADLVITIGAGGESDPDSGDNGSDGEDTFLSDGTTEWTAAGGEGNGPGSANWGFCNGFSVYMGEGDSYFTAEPEGDAACEGGAPGLNPSTDPEAPEAWAGFEEMLGNGGGVFVDEAHGQDLGQGASVYYTSDPESTAMDDAGENGYVGIRWIPADLASTGVDAAPLGIAAAGMLVAGGVGLAIARRARRSK
jgi:hypothetical protein